MLMHFFSPAGRGLSTSNIQFHIQIPIVLLPPFLKALKMKMFFKKRVLGKPAVGRRGRRGTVTLVGVRFGPESERPPGFQKEKKKL